MRNKPKKELDNLLISKVLEREGGKFSLNAAEGHEFMSNLQQVLSEDILENPKEPKLMLNFLIGIENKKGKEDRKRRKS